MVKAVKALMLIFLTMFVPPVYAQEKPILAVAMFEGENLALSAGITEIFITAFSKSDNFTIVERSQIEKVAKEIGLGMSGFVDEKTAAKVGKFLGAKKMIIGSYLDVEGKVILNARLVNVETGKIERTFDREGERGNLSFLVNQLAQDIHKKLTGKWIPELLAEELAKTPEAKLQVLRELDPALFLYNPKAKFKVELWMNKENYKQGEPVSISFKSDSNCYVTVFNVDGDGKVNLIFPNKYVVSNRVKKDEIYTIPEKDADYEFSIAGTPGEEQVIAVATKEPLELVKDLGALVGKEFMPTVSKLPSDFVARSIQVKLKGSPEENWNAARVKFYLEEKDKNSK